MITSKSKFHPNITKQEEVKANNYLKTNHSNLFLIPFAEINNTFAYDIPDIDHRQRFLAERNMQNFVWGVDSDGNFGLENNTEVIKAQNYLRSEHLELFDESFKEIERIFRITTEGKK